ncbi:MAG: DUF1330 domain-containing protein [Chloroflexi bacterium]|nr:DUF1330 domain-containing protein [Chloroflexota bacterium]MDA1219806.1 DUF1330 domain-containing protein [Chloroflexota bacterium]
MAGYVIAQLIVTDPAKFEVYRGQVSATIEQYGGKYLVRGGATETVEGDWNPQRMVILQFESVERAKEWYYSPEYSGPMQLRHQAANSNVVFVEGV